MTRVQTAEPIEVPYWRLTHVRTVWPMNHVSDGAQIGQIGLYLLSRLARMTRRQSRFFAKLLLTLVIVVVAAVSVFILPSVAMNQRVNLDDSNKSTNLPKMLIVIVSGCVCLANMPWLATAVYKSEWSGKLPRPFGRTLSPTTVFCCLCLTQSSQY